MQEIFNIIENKLDTSLSVLGNMHDDEMRARQQLNEVQDLLKNSQKQIRKLRTMPTMPTRRHV